MKTKNYLTLKNLLNALDLEDNTKIELYNDKGETFELEAKNVHENFLNKGVKKYKQDNGIPSLHIKLYSWLKTK